MGAQVISSFLRGLSLMLITASCGFSPGGMSECRMFVPRSPQVAPALADLSAVKAFRNYIAVTRVEPASHHFTLWYSYIEPNMLRVRASRDAAGHLIIEPEGGYWGGLGGAPREIPPVPPEVADLARDVMDELRARCPSSGGWKIAYGGLNRTVTAQELIAHDVDGRGTRRSGWNATVQVSMDEQLTRIVGEVEEQSGFGLVEIPADAQWLTLPSLNEQRLLLGGARTQELSSLIAEAAQRYVSKTPGPALASLVPADAPLLPPGFVSRVAAKVSLYGRAPQSSGSINLDLIAPLDLRDAVFGKGAVADAAVDLGRIHYKLHAALVPTEPRAATPGRTSARYTGSLQLHIEDDHGHTWDHTYPASGPIELEGDAVVAPTGLEIPGASSPSPEYDARHAQLPSSPPFTAVDLYVDVQLSDDPRR